MPFLGMRGTGDWATNQRPEDYRQGILRFSPNGASPLTAITSMMKSRSLTDPKFHWWTKKLPEKGGVATNVYDDVGLATPYTAGGVKGTVVYVKAAAAVIGEFRVGHTCLMTKAVDNRYNRVGKVVARVLNGASSYIAVRLLTAADATYDLDEVNTIYVAGNINAQGATMPDSISYDPVQYTNVTSILRTPLSITRTARKTKLRTGDSYQEEKVETLIDHGQEIEAALLWSEFYEGIGDNGKPETAMKGLIPAIKEFVPLNVDNYSLNPSAPYTGSTWITAGETWLDNYLEQMFRFGGGEKLGVLGSGALLGITRLAKAGGTINLTPKTMAYGLKVLEWITPFGTVFLKTHPLFTYRAHTRNDLLILEPELLKFAFIDDTFFVGDGGAKKTTNTNNSKDGTDEEFITECSMEFHNMDAMGYLSGVGLNNP